MSAARSLLALLLVSCTSPVDLDGVLPRFEGPAEVQHHEQHLGYLTCAGPRLIDPGVVEAGIYFRLSTDAGVFYSFADHLTADDLASLRAGTWTVTGTRPGAFDVRIEVEAKPPGRHVVVRHQYRCLS